MRGRWTDEVEAAAFRPLDAADELPLFGAAERAIPTRPAATVAEQRALPIGGTIEGEYHAWRQTQLGEKVFTMMRRRALDLARQGETRVGIKAVAEWVRSQKVQVDNTLVALIARELRELEPELRDKIELRQRTAT